MAQSLVRLSAPHRCGLELAALHVCVVFVLLSSIAESSRVRPLQYPMFYPVLSVRRFVFLCFRLRGLRVFVLCERFVFVLCVAK